MRKTRRLASVAVVAIVAVMGMLAGPMWAQDQGGMDEDMAAMMAAATPNEHHHNLEWAVGTWKAAGKFWDPKAPEAPAMETDGKCINTMILGGRFMSTEFKGNFLGMSFEGLGVEGYDNLKKQHVATWVDNMGTMILNAAGTCSDDGKVKTMVSEFIDPTTGEMTTMKQVTTFHSDDKHVFEMFTTLPDGNEFKTMEIVYTR